MSKMFCIKCGKDAIKDNLCKQHFLEKNDLFNIENVEIRYCKECESYHNQKIKIKDEEEVIRTLFDDDVKLGNDVKVEKKDFSWKTVGNKFFVTAEITGDIRGVEVKEKKKFIVIARRYMCDNCIKICGGYYEAMIQVRGVNKDKILDKVKLLVPNDSITVIGDAKNGYDVKIIQKGFAKTASKQLRDDGFDVIITHKHVATKKGKMLYRNFYAVR
ncbi:NMD3-related protein [Candidatus Aenigmatarchaeota archaeon]